MSNKEHGQVLPEASDAYYPTTPCRSEQAVRLGGLDRSHLMILRHSDVCQARLTGSI